MVDVFPDRIYIDSHKLREALEFNNISILSLGNKDSANYIGVSERTIRRGLKAGYFSPRTMLKLSRFIDMNRFVKNNED